MYFDLKAGTIGKTLILNKVFHYWIHEGQEKNNRFSYLNHNYNNQRDALAELHLPLSAAQIKWLNRKNKRRFSVNMIKLFIRERSFKKSENFVRKDRFYFARFYTRYFPLVGDLKTQFKILIRVFVYFMLFII
jgi:hypothetical protein